jgi:hypothetical protein
MEPLIVATPAAAALAGLLVVMLRNGWLSLGISYKTRRLRINCRIGRASGRR